MPRIIASVSTTKPKMNGIQTPKRRAAAISQAGEVRAEYRAERVASQSAAASHNPDALLHIDTVCAIVGLSRTSIYDRMRIAAPNAFPQPIRLSARCSRWRAESVTDWLKAQHTAVAK